MSALQQQLGGKPDPRIIAEFLEQTPPSCPKKFPIERIAAPDSVSGSGVLGHGPSSFSIAIPERLRFYCSSKDCGGDRNFELTAPSKFKVVAYVPSFQFLEFRCANCECERKTYAISARFAISEPDVTLLKLGESPEFGAPAPRKLMKMIEKHKELFIKGERCEKQGLGVGAFAYYRQIVEFSLNQIIDSIIMVAKSNGDPTGVSVKLDAAKSERQFGKKLDEVRHAIPSALLVDGQNPFNALHSALSDHLHEGTDEECLEIAAHIRVILVDLAIAISDALRSQSSASAAIRAISEKAQRNRT